MPDQAGAVEFSAHRISGVREGYVTLEWNGVDAAQTYSVSDERSIEVFRGGTPQAFISGLPNGEHLFTVTAIDGSGLVIARSTKPATVLVEHWSLGFALSLFACGLVVLAALIGVLVWGTRTEKSLSESTA
jgi:hypothetical protein